MISFAKEQDIPDIMNFIENYWRPGHILARDEAFFRYMYVDGNSVSFAISRDDDGKLNGIIGYIPYNQEKTEISFALWKALPSAGGFVGIELLQYILDELHPTVLATNGVNISSCGAIYSRYGFEVGFMKHCYRLRSSSEYKIALVTDGEIPLYEKNIQTELIKVSSVDEITFPIACNSNAIEKNRAYIEKRYFKHPIFRYDVYKTAGEKPLYVVMRIQQCNDSRCIRLVDFIGDYSKIPMITGSIDRLLSDTGSEYVDCYYTGIDEKLFESAGWKDVDESGNCIPEYFAPFEQRNIKIGYSSMNPGVILFKGDGDMDRPN